MALRTFVDAGGVQWTVWAVTPTWAQQQPGPNERVVKVSPRLVEGWLAFESANEERRRLTPIPPGWESLVDAELATLCAGAPPAPPRIARRNP